MSETTTMTKKIQIIINKRTNTKITLRMYDLMTENIIWIYKHNIEI